MHSCIFSPWRIATKPCLATEQIGPLTTRVKRTGKEAGKGKANAQERWGAVRSRGAVDSTKRTYRWKGRDYRVTEVHGRGVKELLA